MDFTRLISRRRFAGLLGAGVASGTLRPAFPAVVVGPVLDALHQRKVHVGRRFPALPNHLRVTVGTRSQMERFLAALGESLSS